MALTDKPRYTYEETKKKATNAYMNGILKCYDLLVDRLDDIEDKESDFFRGYEKAVQDIESMKGEKVR